ncbi:MAG: hypothetical protein NTX24_05015 [Candidatus Pacearchaeota archaeon]|nr:hypothetical protein [Candidatus Pacearchaeota archaeon]
MNYKKEKKGELKRALIILVFVVLLTLLFVSASRLGLTGFSVLEKSCLINGDCDDSNDTTTDLCADGVCHYQFNISQNPIYEDIVNLELNNSNLYTWKPENYGQLINAKISGKLLLNKKDSEKGSVKVYLGDKLLLDSSKLEKNISLSGASSTSSSNSLITGLAVGGQSGNENTETTSSVENTGNEANSGQGDIEGETSEGDASAPEISTSEDTTQPLPEPIPEENTTEPTQEPSPEENVTSENTTESSSGENTTNITQEDIIQENITQENTTQENVSEENASQENLTTYEIDFSEICTDTCDLEELNLTNESYELRFELDNATIFIDSITYEIKEIENISEENQTNSTCLTNEDCNDDNESTNDFCVNNACIFMSIKWESPKNKDIFDKGFEHELQVSCNNSIAVPLTLECKIYNPNSEIMQQLTKQFTNDSSFIDYINTSSWLEGDYYENCVIKN